jgi:isopenicillin N synthase-like dioxygenase
MSTVTIVEAAIRELPKTKVSAKIPDPGTIATIDFSDFLCGDETRKEKCLSNIREACITHGFFQIINHTVPLDLQKKIIQASRDFFNLPMEEKMKLDQSQNDHNRGYQKLLSQKYKKEDTAPDLKEGYDVGPDLPWDHPSVIAKQFAHGPNLWPETLGQDFQDVCMEYLDKVNFLAVEVLRAVALALDGDDSFIEEFTTNPICYYKFNHYPKPETTDIGQKGISIQNAWQQRNSSGKLTQAGHGEHKDFGFATLLLQDENPGLEVWEESQQEWIQVPVTEGAFVVNFGNLLQRWSNDIYLSNIHRVVNHSGNDRHSIAHLYHVRLLLPPSIESCLHELII